MGETTKIMKVSYSLPALNQVTGETEDMETYRVEERDLNFYKLWLEKFLYSLDLVGNQKCKFICFLLENMDYENKICMTLRRMAEESEISLDTVVKTMKLLKQSDLIRQINAGAYQVNPDFIFKGRMTKRLHIADDYQSLSDYQKAG